MRKRYVYRDGEMVEVGADYKPEPRQSSWQVLPDIQPYKSMIDGREITSRSRHREHLRAHGCIEIGNETKHLMNPERGTGQIKPPDGLKREIAQIAAEKLRYRR
jgi:hypothetical protein